MAFRAVHGQWGSIDATVPDLGCEQAWEAVWRVRPPAQLTCPWCGHPMYAKVSPKPRRMRFFAHAPDSPTCALAGESFAHHLLKLELANAARAAGAHAELEVRGPDGAWIADVLASDAGHSWALEAQLAAITDDKITARTERMRADGVKSIWFSDRPEPPWLGVVPSVRLAHPDDGGGLVIAEGLKKFGPCGCNDPCCREFYWRDVPATLVQFLGWAFAGRIVPHGTRWTTPRYIAEYKDEMERRQRRETALLLGQTKWMPRWKRRERAPVRSRS